MIKILKPLMNLLFNYHGRINQLEYISGIVIIYGFHTILNLYGITEKVVIIEYSLSIIYSYSLLVLLIKRFHDMGKSGFFALIPIYNLIASILSNSEENNNKYGEYNTKNINIINNRSIGIFIILMFSIISFLGYKESLKNEMIMTLKRGNLSLASGENNNAIDDYNIVINTSNRGSEYKEILYDGYNNKGLALFRLGKYREAIESYENGINLGKITSNEYLNNSIYLNKGNSLMELNKYEDALVSYEIAISYDKNQAKSYYGKGNSLFKVGKYNEAFQAYNNAIMIDQLHLASFMMRGRIYLINGENGKALDNFNQASKLYKTIKYPTQLQKDHYNRITESINKITNL